METKVVYIFVSKSYKSVMIEYNKNHYKTTIDNNTIHDSFDPNNIEQIVLNNKRELINYIKSCNTKLITNNINTIINSIKKFKKSNIHNKNTQICSYA